MVPRIEGPAYSVITPFSEDDSVDYGSLEAYLGQCFESGARVFYAMAYNSRYSQLSDREIEDLNRFVTRTVKGLDSQNIVIVGDPIHCSTEVSKEFCSLAEADGADYISLIFRERFYSEDQVVAHYEACAESTEIGLLVHAMPFLSGFDGSLTGWPLSLLDRLADIPNVSAIKEDAKDAEFSRAAVSLLKDRLDIIISGRGESQWWDVAPLGCQSWLSGTGVFYPALPAAFFSAYKREDSDLMKAIIDKIEVPFFDRIVSRFGWHLSAKLMLEACGFMSRKERLPLQEISDLERSKVDDDIRIILESCDSVLSDRRL